MQYIQQPQVQYIQQPQVQYMQGNPPTTNLLQSSVIAGQPSPQMSQAVGNGLNQVPTLVYLN